MICNARVLIENEKQCQKSSIQPSESTKPQTLTTHMNSRIIKFLEEFNLFIVGELEFCFFIMRNLHTLFIFIYITN